MRVYQEGLDKIYELRLRKCLNFPPLQKPSVCTQSEKEAERREVKNQSYCKPSLPLSYAFRLQPTLLRSKKDLSNHSVMSNGGTRRIHVVIDLNLPPPDVDALGDEVVFMSARAFVESGSSSGGNRANPVVIDADSEETAASELINLEGSANGMNVQPPSTPPPAELIIPCPVCLGPFVEEMTTKCGHIFCKACIMNAIATQRKCPTCQNRVVKRDLIRIYLPSPDY